MSKLILYSDDVSPPCRAVLAVGAALGLKFEIRTVDLFKQETLDEKFAKINPQHTVPTLDEDGFILWDSHAIICYLVDKYAKDDSLYPKDLKVRAIINQRLHFNNGVLFSLLRSTCKPIIDGKVKAVPEDKVVLIKEAFDFLNKFLEGKEWLIGNSYTIADFASVVNVLALGLLVPYDNYLNIKSWLKRCEEKLPGYKTFIQPGQDRLKKVWSEKLA